MNIIKTRIIRIGNSQGIRIPKLLLEQTNLGEEVDLELRDNSIVISASHTTRSDWNEQFRMMAEKGDDRLLDGTRLLSSWDEEEWEW